MRRAFVILFFIFGTAVLATAQTDETITLSRGQQKNAAHGIFSVRFVALVEDSRCPVHATCVWAGNAKVKIRVLLGRKGWKELELNTGLEPRTVDVDRYKITLVSVDPKPGEKRKGHTARPKIELRVWQPIR